MLDGAAERDRMQVIEAPPPDRIPATPEDFLRWLAGPSLIRVRGRSAARTRVVSTLLHGNEPSGLRAFHAYLREAPRPAVDALLVIGAVECALAEPGFAYRALPGRPDLNRCFKPPFSGPEGALAGEMLARVRAARPEALVDLHNNTGHNPPYAVAPLLGAAEVNLAGFFAELLVHTPLRLGTLVEATQHEFPSVTVEAGRAGDPEADALALRGLRGFLDAERLETTRVVVPRMRVLEKPVRVRILPDLRLAFGERPARDADLTVVGDIDRHNFEQLGAGVAIGWVAAPEPWPIEALGADDRDRSRELFRVREVGKGYLLETRRPLIPIMMTTHPEVARSDCLFYAVEEGAQVGRARSPERAPGPG